MRILLTGATGFIGSHILELLLKNDIEVLSVTRSHAKELPCTTVIADLCDASSIPVLKEAAAGCDVVIHMAATLPDQSNPTQSAEEMILANVDSTKHLLESLPSTIRHIILGSSIDIYGPPQFLPVTEEHPLNPVTAYARSKAETESITDTFCKEHAIPLTILRFTQIFGPREKPIKAIPLFIREVANGRAPTLFGDGSDKRDYLYVSDAAEATLAAIQKQTAGIMTIASGRSSTLKETLETIIRISGKDLVPVYKERQKEKIDITLDVSRAKEILGFEAKTTLEEGLALNYDWYCKNAL